MDDRDAYILNTLWTKHFDLGRIVRFRHLTRGRQASTLEVLTSEQHEYLAYLYPPAFDPNHLNWVCQTLNTLDKERFSVVPMLPARDGRFAVGGPQGTSLAVSLHPPGQILLPDQWTAHDISQLALRLAWLHRLLSEQLPDPPNESPAIALENTLIAARANTPGTSLPPLNPAALDNLLESLDDAPPPAGYCHGDVQPAAFLIDEDHQIRTLVDWALLHPGNPLEDLIDAFTHWCVAPDGVVNPETGRVLIESYRSLRDLPPHPWDPAVKTWCARRLIDATYSRRPLPRNFPLYLTTPSHLARALELCEAK